MSPERDVHSLGAYQKAKELAERFHLSEQEQLQAGIAGLLHDAAKLMSPTDLIGFCDYHDIPIDAIDRATPQTLHPFVGAELVQDEFGITDAGTLDAIRYHTTGRKDMSPVEKVVYVADKIEDNTRNPLYIKKVTSRLTGDDPVSLDLTMLYILDSTIQFLLEKTQLIHPRTLDARNELLESLKAKNAL